MRAAIPHRPRRHAGGHWGLAHPTRPRISGCLGPPHPGWKAGCRTPQLPSCSPGRRRCRRPAASKSCAASRLRVEGQDPRWQPSGDVVAEAASASPTAYASASTPTLDSTMESGRIVPEEVAARPTAGRRRMIIDVRACMRKHRSARRSKARCTGSPACSNSSVEHGTHPHGCGVRRSQCSSRSTTPGAGWACRPPPCATSRRTSQPVTERRTASAADATAGEGEREMDA
ncbi:unnamed protein product [Urochloa humidicola]